MKEIIIQSVPHDKRYLVTDTEFREATARWAKGNSYYCGRLEALIPSRYKWAETPREDLGFEVFIRLLPSGGYKKFFKKDGKYYQDIFDGEKNRKVEAPLEDKEKRLLISQEDYYKDKKYLE